jgi:PAS domain S-box
MLCSRAISLEKAGILNENFFDVEKTRYGENANFSIITISGNFNNMGTIYNLNNEVTRILGYTKNELMGQNIKTIMPKSIADIHGDLVKRYVETGVPHVIGKERYVFPIDRHGYLVPCTLLIKGLPNLDEGIRFVGFMHDIYNEVSDDNFFDNAKPHYVLYSGNTGLIHAIDYNCRQSFGIPGNICWGADASSVEFTIDSIFPELNANDVEVLKARGGIITYIDTTHLPLNFLVNVSGEHEDETDGAA